MYETRLWLSKRGRIRFVSHLDMFRLMTRAVRRAHIPLWYTEGFNPHPYISFLLALSLGVEGEREPIDIRIVDDAYPMEQVAAALNAVLPEGLRVEAATVPEMKPAAITWGEYTVTYDKAELSAEELTRALESGALETEKSGKSGGRKVMKKVGVSEHIRSWALEEKPETLILRVVLPAGSVLNLNPQQLTDAVNAFLGTAAAPVRAVRQRLLDADGREFR